MDTKHTPGPWIVDTSTVLGPFGIETISEDVPRVKCIVCTFTSERRQHEEDRSRLEADARLIAAAPDLLEACVLALSVGEALERPNDENQRIYLGKSTIAALRAAIARATGGPS